MGIEDKANAVIEARKTIAPVEKDFYVAVNNFATTVQEFCRTNRWYTSENKWSALGLYSGYIWGDQAQIVNNTVIFYSGDYEDDANGDMLTFTFDEIDNPVSALTDSYRAWKISSEKRKGEWRKKEREALERRLRELDN